MTMTSHEPQPAPVSRRSVLAGTAGAAGAAGVAMLGVGLVGCAADPEPPGSTAQEPTTVRAADVPVGGGTVVDSAAVVVTQPVAGEFKAFNATCTHQGCIVVRVENGAIICPCHNSRFSATDGSVMSGPATKGLAAKEVTAAGDTLTIP
jgi:Rieske Fe-S protein